MKLYYSPGACSLSPHIILRESGLVFEPVLASTKTKTLADGTDYNAINPKGQVPLLELDDGERLSEGPVIVQFVSDQVPEKKLLPPAGTLARLRVLEWLNFITSEIHKGYSPLFRPEMPEEGKAFHRNRLAARYQWIDGQLAGKSYLTGENFTPADSYLFTVTRWANATGVDAGGPNVAAFMERVAARPAVQEAMKVEGLLK